MSSRLLFVPALVCALAAAPLPKANPADVGVSPERLARVRSLLESYIERGEIAGSVALIARRGRIAHFEAQGVMDLESRKPMSADTLFRLASMTKPVTSLAAMMLHEEGRFLLDDPISKFLPEFSNSKVAIANAPHERVPEGYRTVAAERAITVRHLLTHTAGLATSTSGPLAELVRKITRKPDETLADWTPRLAALPLSFQPGSAWEYGSATDVLGRLVEAVSGRTLDQFFRERIFEPLGMTDTHFYLPAAKIPRLASAYTKKGNALEKLTAPGPTNPNGRFYSGGGGLSGSAEDYLRLSQMFLNGGVLEGKRLVSRKTVEMMAANQIGSIPMWRDSLRGYRFGLGFRVRTDLGASATLGSLGDYGWGGAYGTYFWIDPKEEMVGILMIQLLPYAHINVRQEFQNAATQAIVD